MPSRRRDRRHRCGRRHGGGANVDGLLRSLNAGGRFVIVGFASGQIPHFPANYLLLKDLVVYGSSLDRLFRERDPALRQGILEAFDLLATGRMTAEVDSVLPFSRFADGVERLRDRRSAGKIVFRGSDVPNAADAAPHPDGRVTSMRSGMVAESWWTDRRS